MVWTTPQEVKQLFNLEALRDEAMAQLTGRQWEKRGELVDRCKKASNMACRLLVERGDVRIAIARKKLIDEAGSKTKEHKPFFAQNDRFDNEATLRQAKQKVWLAHKQRLARINQYEERELSNLMAEAKRENQLQGKAERGFNQVADRRRTDGLPRSRARIRKQQR